MANLQLMFPSIPFDALVRAQSVSFSEDRPVGNTIAGERYQYSSATAGASGALNMEWDLGVNAAGVNNTRAVDTVIVANAQKLISQGTTSIALDAGDQVAGTYANVWTDASFNLATLVGGDSYDYITHSLNLAAARSWKVKLLGGAATTREINKIYFGQSWNPNKDCNYNYQIKQVDGGTVSMEDGGLKCVRLADGRYQVSLVWSGITDALTQTFSDRVIRYWQQHKFFLFTTGEHRILNNLKCLHVRCLNMPTISRRTVWRGGAWVGYNTISANFQECKG